MEERLQKIIARAGLASRREAESMIVSGRVSVNGRVVDQLGSKADPERDHIKVDGKLVSSDVDKVYILMNKPKGVVSTVHDTEDRPVITSLIKGVKGRIYPVGRLDFNTEGAILLTNDGELSNRLLSAKSRCPKTYLVKISGQPSIKDLSRLERGVTVEGARFSQCEIEPLKVGVNSWLKVTLNEGKNHQVKKMFEHVGHPVSKLKRVAFSFLTVKGLDPGEWRRLTPQEADRLRRGRFRPEKPIDVYKFLKEYGVSLTDRDRKKLSLYLGRPRIFPSAPPKTAPARPGGAPSRNPAQGKARTLSKLKIASKPNEKAPIQSVSVYRKTDDEAVARKPYPKAKPAEGPGKPKSQRKAPGGYGAKRQTSTRPPAKRSPPNRAAGGKAAKKGRRK